MREIGHPPICLAIDRDSETASPERVTRPEQDEGVSDRADRVDRGSKACLHAVASIVLAASGSLCVSPLWLGRVAKGVHHALRHSIRSPTAEPRHGSPFGRTAATPARFGPARRSPSTPTGSATSMRVRHRPRPRNRATSGIAPFEKRAIPKSARRVRRGGLLHRAAVSPPRASRCSRLRWPADERASEIGDPCYLPISDSAVTRTLLRLQWLVPPQRDPHGQALVQ